MSRAGFKARVARLEAQQPKMQEAVFVPFEPSEAWWREFWTVCEASGSLRDILTVLGIPEADMAQALQEVRGGQHR